MMRVARLGVLIALLIVTTGCAQWLRLGQDAIMAPRLGQALLLGIQCYTTGECFADISQAINARDGKAPTFNATYQSGSFAIHPQCRSTAEQALRGQQIFFETTSLPNGMPGLCILDSDTRPRSWDAGAAVELVSYGAYNERLGDITERLESRSTSRGMSMSRAAPSQQLAPVIERRPIPRNESGNE